MIKKPTVILLLLWAAVLFWMGVIFTFSSETAEESLDTSDGVLSVIIHLLDDDFDTYSEEKQMSLLEQYSFFIRKAAHFSVYAFLGFLTSNAFAFQNKVYGAPSKGKRIVSAILIGSIYSVSDEVHQYFVPGRSCSVRDMLIDSAGVVTGVFVSLLLVRLLFKLKKNPS